MNKDIFKTYDIRGVYPDQINEQVAYLVGKAFSAYIKEGVVVVGRDGRESSLPLFKRVCKAITESGLDVLDIGVTNTPLLNFTLVSKNYNGAVMITASHNPAEFNGLKLIKRRALQMYGDEIQKIKQIIDKEQFISGEGKKMFYNPIEDYKKHVLNVCGEIYDLKIVIDCGNGVGSVTARPVLSQLDIKTVFMYEDINGFFPNHDPNPHYAENILPLQKKVVEEGADLGVFFDGDADRSIIIDEKGDIVSPDMLLSLLAEEELLNNFGERIYYDLRFSRAVKEKIESMGGKPEMMRVGNPFYKEKIITEGGVLGGELSGHIMFKINYGIDDGLFAALRTMSAITKKKKPLSKLISPLKKYFQSEEISMEVKNKKQALEKVKAVFKDGEELFIDGVYISYSDWWFSLRQSNTEDLVRLRLEADSKELLENKKEEIISLLRT